MKIFTTVTQEDLHNYPHIKVGSFEEDSITFDKIKYTPTALNAIDISNHPEVRSSFDLEINIACLYPPKGFIGWHTNSNFERWNAIMTYSETGDGYFEYYDNGYHKVPDVKGVSVKKTHWTSEKIMWHRAYTNCTRVTIAVCSKKEEDIDNFINNLSYK